MAEKEAYLTLYNTPIEIHGFLGMLREQLKESDMEQDDKDGVMTFIDDLDHIVDVVMQASEQIPIVPQSGSEEYLS